MADKPEIERGNSILPPPPIPSMVRMSMVPPPPIPVPKIVDGEPVIAREEEEEEKTVDVVVDVVEPIEKISLPEKEIEVNPKGIITISLFENRPFEVEFSGHIAGNDIDHAWRAMMKEYRVWKHMVFRKQEAEKSGGV